MADEERKSKIWKPTGKKIDPKDNNLTKDKFADYILELKESDINYDLIMQMFGQFGSEPALARSYDLLIVPAGKFTYKDEKGKNKSNKNEFTTTVGQWFINVILRDFNFSRFFGYYDKTITTGEYKKIEKRLSYALIEDEITTEDLKKWENMVQWLMPCEDIISPNHTEKLITCSKAIDAKRKELLKKYDKEIKAGDIATVEKISNELLDYAKKYMGDDPAFDPLLSGAGGSIGNNFKNTYVMRGAILNPDPYAKQKYNIVTSNLMDGVTAEEYSTMAGSGVQGAYSRGKKTRTGGYWEKLMVSAYQHIHLDPKGSDCHTNKTVRVHLTDKNIDLWMYNYILKPDGSYDLLDYKARSKYIGKTVNFRFASMCKSKTGICNICAGELLYQITDNVGMTMSQVGSTLKNINMKSFHDAVVHTTKFNAMEAFYQDDMKE